MADMGVNVPVIITATKQTGAIAEAAAELRGVGSAAAQAAQQATAGAAAQAAAITQASAAAQQFGAAYRAALASARTELQSNAAVTTAAAAQERAGIAQAIALLALKARAADTANADEVAGLQEAIASQRAQMEAVGATEAEYTRLDLVLQALQRRVVAVASAEDAAAAAAARTATQLDGISPQRLMRTAGAVNQIEFALEGAGGGAMGLARSLGQVAQTAGLLAEGASWAMMATGIGAVVMVAVGLAEALHKANGEVKASPLFTEQLGQGQFTDIGGHFEVGKIDKMRADLDASAKRQQDALGQYANGDYLLPWTNAHKAMVAYEATLADISDLEKRRRDGLEAEHRLNENLAHQRQVAAEELAHTSVAEMERLRTEYALAAAQRDNHTELTKQYEAIDEAEQADERRIQNMFRLKDEYGHLRNLEQENTAESRALLAVERALLEAARDTAAAKHQALASETGEKDRAYQRATASAGADNRYEQYEARLAEIHAQEEADILAGRNAEDVEARTQTNIRKLRKETLQGTLSDLNTLEQATIHSGNAQVRAIGTFANAIRRLVIGAKAAEAAVDSAKAFGAALAMAGMQDYQGAALEVAAGTQLAAAAAMGFRESMGGGGASGGGGGGSGGAGQTTFTPNAQKDAGQQNIYLVTRDPYGRDAIQRVAYELDRSGKLNRPIPIAPTTGLVPMAS